MTAEKVSSGKLISTEQMAEHNKNLWGTLNLMVAINNTFLERMQRSTTLGPNDERELELWSKAFAKASQGVHDTLERMNSRPEGGALN